MTVELIESSREAVTEWLEEVESGREIERLLLIGAGTEVAIAIVAAAESADGGE